MMPVRVLEILRGTVCKVYDCLMTKLHTWNQYKIKQTNKQTKQSQFLSLGNKVPWIPNGHICMGFVHASSQWLSTANPFSK